MKHECRAHDFFMLGTQRVVDAEGFLHAPGVIARAGNVQEYRASELGLDGDPNRVIRLYRPREEVARSCPSFGRRPITDDHPPEKWVDANNWEKYAVGDTDDDVRMQGDDMVAGLNFRKRASVDALQSGKVGLSNGYLFNFDDERKTTPEGEAVDGWMTDIRGNHVALVDRGRGGPGCVVADKDKENKMATRLITIGALQFDIDANAAAAVEAELGKGKQIAADAEESGKREKAAEARAVAAEAAGEEYKARIAALDAEVKELKDHPPAPDPKLVETLAEERATVVADAAKIAPDLKAAGKPVEQVRREAIAARVEKDPRAKVLVDAALAGAKLDAAAPEVVKTIFSAVVTLAGSQPVNDGLAADMLRAGSGNAGLSGKVEDGEKGLVGYDLYAYRLNHPKRPTA